MATTASQKARNYWLVKSEPTMYSISHLARDKETPWDGVRNYQARNYLRAMQVGDLVLFYHSNEDPIGVAGIAEVKGVAEPEKAQFDEKSGYYDPEVKKDNPRWFSPLLTFHEQFPQVLPLDTLRGMKELAELQLLKRGNRLSVLPVEEKQFNAIVKRASQK